MAEFRKLVDSWKLPSDQRERVDKALQTVFPESFAKSSGLLASQMDKVSDAASKNLAIWERFGPPLSQLTDGMGRLNSQTSPLSDAFRNTQSSASQVPGALDSVVIAADAFASRMNGVKPPAQSIGPVNGLSLLPQPFKPTSYPAQSKNVGIVPASLTHRSVSDISGARAAVSKREFNFHAPLVSINGNAPAAADPDALAETIFARLAQEEQIAEERT
jgi:X-X-X-Leu-X-X-Gly heptad repeat protein